MNDTFFIEVAQAAARQSTCLRRKFGCVIIDPVTQHIISTGFNGSPCGEEHCTDIEYCMREELNIPRGERYELCRSTHDCMNALLQAGKQAYNCTIYACGFDAKTMIPITMPKPCFLCTKMAINSGIANYFVWTGLNVISIDLHVLYNQYIQEMTKSYMECVSGE